MKSFLLFISIFFISLLLMAKPVSTKTDSRFVGTWTGFDEGIQIAGTKRYWVQHRMKNGTFIILFTNIDKEGKVESFAEKGKWWVDGNVFHEKAEGRNKGESYTFTIENNKKIHFKLIVREDAATDLNYQFTDTKLE